MSRPLFVYGTLLLPDVRRQVIGRDVTLTRATLPGFRRVQLAGRNYPGVAPSTHDAVGGLLLEGIGPGDIKRLDRYEGIEYVRKPVTVETSAGKRRAWAYLPRVGIRLTKAE